MTYRSVLVLDGEVAIASTLSGRTATELAQYALGYYESMHTMIDVVYPLGKRAFLLDVLCNGYSECTEVSQWQGIKEIVEIKTDDLEPTPPQLLDHESFRDVYANRLIMKLFAANL